MNGYALDVTMFRTLHADALLNGKPVKLKRSRSGVYPLPNEANIRDTVMKRAGTLIVGKQQGNKNDAKLYGWLEYKKGADVGKLFAYEHTGRSYPLDSVRVENKKSKLLVKALKAARKTYNNPLAAELTAFKLNLIGSENVTLPHGLHDVELVLTNEAYPLTGSLFNGLMLGELSDTLDNFMTYWKRDSLLRNADNAEEIKNLLHNINDAFDEAIDDTTDVETYSPLVLRGKFRFRPSIFYGEHCRVHNSTGQTNNTNQPNEIVLMQNYPNPFNPTTAIGFSLLAVGNVSLKVYDVLGREVATLLNNEQIEAGEHEIQFDANGLTSGMYFYRLNVDGKFSKRRNCF